MSIIRAIGMEIERERSRSFFEKKSSYKAKIYTRSGQKFWENFQLFFWRKIAVLFKKVARRKLEIILFKNDKFLEIIKKYGPQIQEAVKEKEKYFYQWESENRYYGNGYSETLRLEREASKKANGLHNEARELLLANGWNKYYLFTPNSLIIEGGSGSGRMSTEPVVKYWDFLDFFFENKVEKIRSILKLL